MTIVPAADKEIEHCRLRTKLEMVTQGPCYDMMFSGHTALTYLTCPPKYRIVVVPVIMTLLVLVEYHYMSDVFVAVLIS